MVTSWQAYLEKKELLSPAFLFWKVHAFPLNYLCSLKGANWAQHLSQCWFLFCKSLFRWKDSQPTNQIRFDQSKLTTYLWKITQLIKLPVLVYQVLHKGSQKHLYNYAKHLWCDSFLFFNWEDTVHPSVCKSIINLISGSTITWPLSDSWRVLFLSHDFFRSHSLYRDLTAIKQNKPWIDA